MKTPSPQPFSRRHFVRTTALTAAGAALAAAPKSAPAADPIPGEPTFCTFIKPLQDLSFDDAAKNLAAFGFDGIEATVRNKGQVLPERVEEDLPKMVEAFKKRNLEITLMATDINAVNPLNEKVLRTAAALGIPRYRMSYYKYDLNEALPPQLESFKAPLAELVALNRELGIQGIYQNHSGADYCGAALWDLNYHMRDHPKKFFASGYDIGHALVEGGKCWPQHLALMLPYIEILYVKGPAYKEGMIDFGPLDESAHEPRKLFGMLKKGGFEGPYNLHIEYHVKSADVVNQTLRDMPRDLATLKKWIAEA